MLERTNIAALLGPTNTGKTYRAIERMLEHHSGMLGLPLRLLAREVYDRVTSRVGEGQVALVTGEEKRVPPRARYFICTVEAMPIERSVDFLAVDEIQLAAHRQRGHVFTDRLLNARGRLETWFMGSDSMRPLIGAILPHAELRTHPRLSRLRSTGVSALGQLPPRSVVVAFSMSRVYEIAERLRRRRGGAAVVLGALSPRARNAQVAMYQAGEVDHMVATDAIGMGLNLDLEHVSFADLSKFDGRESRALDVGELAQIAGRAGRYHTDGSFGTLAPLPPLPLRVARAIEHSEIPPERKLVWRSSDLCFSDLSSLIESLKQPPKRAFFGLVERADDFSALTWVAARADIRERVIDEDSVRLLWDTCQIPDYQQLLPEAHARLVAEVFLQLTSHSGRVDAEWLSRQIKRLDDSSGDIDTLLMRMAFIRTWTYVSSHAGWVEDSAHFQGVTRQIEDRLSDALHARLVERFVDPKKSRRGGGRSDPHGPFAALRLLRPIEETEAVGETGWVEQLVEAPHERFRVDASGRIHEAERAIGVLTRGSDLLRPEVRLEPDLPLAAGAAQRLQRRLVAWSRDLVGELFAPLRGERATELSPAGRGLVYQLEQGLGTVRRRSAATQIEHLTENDRQILVALGVTLGRELVFLRSLAKSRALEQRAALWNASAEPERRLSPPDAGSLSFEVGPDRPSEADSWLALGYLVLGKRAVRADAVERAASRLAEGPADGQALALIGRWTGCPRAQVRSLVASLNGTLTRPARRRRRRARPPAARAG